MRGKPKARPPYRSVREHLPSPQHSGQTTAEGASVTAAQEARLDMEEERVTEAYESGALPLHEYQTMLRVLDRQRAALYAREEGDDVSEVVS